MAVSATAMTTSHSIDACRRRCGCCVRDRANGAGDTPRDRLAAAAERELVLAAKHGGAAEREELVEAFVPLVGSVARIYRSRAQVDRTELMQEGVVGLLRALERFDPQRGTPFWMYASWWVRQAMQQLVSELGRPIVMSDRALRKIARIKDAQREHLQRYGREPSLSAIAETIGLPRAEVESLMAAERSPRALEEPVGGDHNAGITLGEVLDDPRASEAFDRIPLEIEVEQLPRVLAVLDKRERTIICARFGLEGQESTLGELGEQLGVSAERVRQIEEVSLGKLRETMS
ncbi:MAG: polymerase primary sigma factor [Solirubrobacteraceae bacterium]|nr:polymerase primary sigma factor [Solirubrobacteraceae bacterium]